MGVQRTSSVESVSAGSNSTAFDPTSVRLTGSKLCTYAVLTPLVSTREYNLRVIHVERRPIGVPCATFSSIGGIRHSQNLNIEVRLGNRLALCRWCHIGDLLHISIGPEYARKGRDFRRTQRLVVDLDLIDRSIEVAGAAIAMPADHEIGPERVDDRAAPRQ